MAPQMSKTAAAAAAVAGTAFVAIPSQGPRSSAPSSGSLHGARGSSGSALGSAPTIAVLGATAVAAAALRKKDSQAVKATALQAFENELGVQAPLGFWDPAGLSSDGDAKEFYRRRVVEIKHGRVSMLACTGYIVQEFFRFPGYISPSSEIKFTDIPNGLAAATKVPAVGWFQYTVFCGICDLWLMHQVPTNPPGKLCTRLFGEETTNYEYGSLGLPGYLGGKAIADPEIKKKKLNAEIANGRLAMMAIIGMFFQDGLAGSAWGDWANYTESPLRAFENELGVQAPVGYFDPLGLSKDGDVETFRRRREAELKNGRVAMFATIGYMVPEYFKFPGYLAPSSNLKFADVPNGIAAITKVPAEGWLQWVALCGCYEFCVNTPVDPADPGNYGKGKFGYGNMVLGITAEPMQDPEGRKRALNSELANGRLAMMAILGLWVQDGLFGTPYGLYTGSSAFETELGVQPPVGFWDPLGFTKTDDAASFRRRRYVELKHGRVAMFACLGYMVPEYYRWPGDLSPSLGLKFSDVPSGFAAFSKVPLSGWAQMVAFAGTVELFQYVDDPKRAPGDFENAGFLGVPNSYIKAPAGTKEKKLAAEIANGRLAMMAIIGMFFQNGLTGEAWGDWSLYTDSPLRALTPAQECIAGTGGPFPEDFWDPAGITGKKSKEEILQLRAMELKHGRVAMLATVGWIATDLGLRVPGDAFQISTIEAHDAMVKFGSMPQILVWLGYLELFGFLAIINMQEGKTDRKPGDFGLRGFYPADAKGQYDMQVKELRNGRLAMLAFSGIATVGVLTQEKWPFFDAVVNAVPAERKASSASSFCGSMVSRSRGSTMARQAATSKSMPFLPKPQNLGGLVGGEAEFDPLGFSDTFDVKWLREAELKHGRVCMLATIGFAAEQYVQFPGCPETPDALQAIYTAPVNLTGLLLFAAGYIESTSYNGKLTMLDMFEGEGAKRAPGDLNFGKRFLPGDKAKADDLATKELNNGRLAMLAFSGMVHHNLVVKGPLFPLFPEGWEGPQGSWDLDSTAGALNSGRLGL